MKKPTKLNLNDLKVESFVTSLEVRDSQTIKGGSTEVCLSALSVSASVTVATIIGTIGSIIVCKTMRAACRL